MLHAWSQDCKHMKWHARSQACMPFHVLAIFGVTSFHGNADLGKCAPAPGEDVGLHITHSSVCV